MKIRIILNIILLTSATIFAQSKSNIIATIGDKTITSEELKNRFEFTPQISKTSNNIEESKEELLYTIIAEKLFALEAEQLGYDTLSSFKMNYTPTEKMYVRDVLYKNVITDKIVVDSRKLNNGFEFSSFKLYADFIYANEEYKIRAAFKKLNTIPNFDSLVTTLQDVKYVNKLYEVEYGKMFEHAEEAIYNLNIGEFTSPIKSPEGWFIFRLLDKVPVTFTNIEEKKSTIKKVVTERSEDSLYGSFMNDFFSNRKISTNGSLFWYLSDKIRDVLILKKADGKIADGKKINLGNNDILKLKTILDPDSLSKIFIQFETSPIKLHEFLNDFMFEGFSASSTDKKEIASKLNFRVKRFIEHELLSRNGYKKGFENLTEVKKSTNIWRDNYLSTLYIKNNVIETKFSDSDIQKINDDLGLSSISDVRVNVLEILTDSLEVIQEALSIQNNKDFRIFANNHTKRDWTKNQGGEFGFFSTFEHGDIGEIAKNMEVGDIYGPLKTEEGYSVFKLIGKKDSSLSITTSKINEETKNKIRYSKIKTKLDDLAVKLANKFNVIIDNDKLKSVDVVNTQMIIYRNMGFGGKILAFPHSIPFHKWKNKWEHKKKDLL